MGEVLPMPNPLNKISCRFVERKWMRSAKAWRCFVELPAHTDLAIRLTALIEDQVTIHIDGDVSCTMEPAFVVDVPSKGKKFFLVFETVYEHQAKIGTYLTALTDSMVTVRVAPFVAEPGKPQNKEPLSPKELQGLHLQFFHNETFWAYLEHITGGLVINNENAKQTFKKYLGVESCKDIERSRFLELVRDFNAWIRARK